MIDKLRKRRDELQELLKQTSIQVEQLRGALAMCNELLIEAEGNGVADADTRLSE